MTLSSGEQLPSPFVVIEADECRIQKVERYEPQCWNLCVWTKDGWQYDDDIGEESATMLYQSEQVFVGAE